MSSSVLMRCVCVVGLLLITTVARAQTTYYVNGGCGDNAWTGTSSVCAAPNGPKATIQAAINVTSNGDVVFVGLTVSAAILIRAMSATDVPPNFCTIRAIFPFPMSGPDGPQLGFPVKARHRPDRHFPQGFVLRMASAGRRRFNQSLLKRGRRIHTLYSRMEATHPWPGPPAGKGKKPDLREKRGPQPKKSPGSPPGPRPANG